MLQNIFLIHGKNLNDLDQLEIFSYPDDVIKIERKDLVRKIIYEHDHGHLAQQYRNKLRNPAYSESNQGSPKNIVFIIDTPYPQVIDNLNIYSSCINGEIIIGLIFEKEDNPLDYKEIFEELLNELVNANGRYFVEEEIEIENLLISIFIDIRRFGDENIETHPEIKIQYDLQECFVKVFLFGLDEAGKTSLIRRIKIGEYNDNYFSPTRKFNIDYVQEKRGLLALWDMPGQQAFREKWLIGLQESNITIFMIDVANQLRFEEAKTEFWKILNRNELDGVPLLILGNKVDLINSLSKKTEKELMRLKKEIFEYFNFGKLKNRKWIFLFTSVKTNYNIDTVIDSIFNSINLDDIF